MRRGPFPLLAIALVLTVVGIGCGADPVGPREPEDVNFHPSLGINLSQMTRTQSGLYYRVLEEGTGTDAAISGDRVSFEYDFWLPNGEVIVAEGFQSATLGGGAVGEPDLIPGVDEGLRGTRVGETRQLVIPYYLGYGAEPHQGLPAFATLIFEVTIAQIVRSPGV